MLCTAEINPIFQPAMRLIQTITRGNPTLVETTFANQYKTGLIVRLLVPEACGMPQINKLTGQITVVDAVSFTISIDSTEFDPFFIPPLLPIPGGVTDFTNICAQVIPIGEGNEYLDSYSDNVNRIQGHYKNP